MIRSQAARTSTPAGPRNLLRTVAPAAFAAVLAISLAACGSASTDSTPAAGGGASTQGSAGSPPALSGTVTVLAAASLTNSFDVIKTEFEAANPGVTVEVSYGSTATLVQQVNNGAPANVLASAGQSAIEPLQKNLVKGSSVFATNVLEIAVPPANPADVTSINDLGKPTVKVVLCADTVPCGKAAAATFTKARVVPNVVSKEIDVKATLAKVTLDEADAAVVYHSDVVAANGAVKGIEIPSQYNTTLRYPIVTLSDEAATRAFVAFVLSSKGLMTVQSFGLGAP
ncbi:MAG: molybdate ABC transporter substrate-binding protein [Humibacillus sp.]|nr:molybdate ABC transporter substrate-binding protein [Humibacillus sp.]MDN5778734.1 molybdate ABC transporter substrate-binding protein [Humibacillus sp.]